MLGEFLVRRIVPLGNVLPTGKDASMAQRTTQHESVTSRALLVRAFETAITTFGGQSIIAAVAKKEDSRYPGLDLTVRDE